MHKRFLLTPDFLKMLRCFEYEGMVGDRKVSRVSIFSSADATEKSLVLKTRHDLEKYPDMILFEGYVDKQGNAYAADRRTPKKGKKIHRSINETKIEGQVGK